MAMGKIDTHYVCKKFIFPKNTKNMHKKCWLNAGETSPRP